MRAAMPRFSPNAQMPLYLQRFACIGGSCPQSCCEGSWTVTLNRQIWNKYRSIPLHPVNQHMQPVVDSGTKDDIAGQLIMRPDGRCHMQNEQGLCDIHSTMGDKALSDTCRNYPRLFHSVEGQVHVFATLSCPETARLALSSDDAMVLGNKKLEQFDTPLEMPRPQELDVGSGFFREVHSTCAMALRDRLLWLADVAPSGLQALQLWALLVRQVAQWQGDWQAYNQAHPNKPIEHSMGIYTEKLAERLESWDSIAVQNHLDLVRGLDSAENQRVRVLVMQASMDLISRYLPASSELQPLLRRDQDWPVLLAQGAASLSQLDTATPWALKNLIRNDLWRNMWYSHVFSASDLESEFLMLTLKVTVMRMLLCAMASQQQTPLGLNDMIKLTYMLSRHIEHNQGLRADWLKNLASHQFDNAASALIILGH